MYEKRSLGKSCIVISICLSALHFSFFTNTGFAEDAPAHAQIEGAQFSFGSVPQGTAVTHEFTIKNTGGSDLAIERVVTGCGCTTAAPSTSAILPGESTTISVTFDTAGFEGEKTKNIRIFTNDPVQPVQTVTLTGTVVSPIVINPPRVDFGKVVKGQSTAPKLVAISLKDGVQGYIKNAKTYSKNILLTVDKKGERSTNLEISLSPEATGGELRERVEVLVEKDGKEQLFTVPVIASVKNDLVLIPQVLQLGIIEGSTEIVRSVRLLNKSKEPLEIVSVTSSSSLIDSKLTTKNPGKEFLLTIKVNPSNVNRDFKESVLIKTNRADGKDITLNIYGVVPPKK